MTVSVLIPLYNQGKFVTETLDSVLAQTYRDFEVVCVNDASTDDSLDIVTKYAAEHSKVRVINNAVNRGLPATRNVALANSIGDMILPLDSDDLIDSSYLEKTVSRMTEGVGVVSTWMLIFGMGRERSGAPGSSYPIFTPTPEQITSGNSLPVCSLIRRETLLDAGGWPEDFSVGSDDWALWAAIVHAGKWRVDVIPEYLFNYRVHKNSMCRSRVMPPFSETLAKMRARYGA